MSTWSSSSSSASSRTSSKGDGSDTLKLGVKGRLRNQEMEQLKQKLAQAVAYDHVPETKLAERHAKPTSKPMTRVYRKLEPEAASHHQKNNFRPSIKPQATIEYEKKFMEGSYDSMRMRPAPKGITAGAKTILQDEYVTRPREISVIPRNKLTETTQEPHTTADHTKTGKRLGPAAIPQVFIL